MKHAVLFVDDDNSLLDLLRDASEDWGFDTYFASSGEDALQIIGEHKIHIGVVDQRMPGMTGLELLDRFQEEAPDIVRIMVTGYANVDSAIDAINQGAVFRFVRKPFNLEQLRSLLKDAALEYDKNKSRRLLFRQMEKYRLIDEGDQRPKTADMPLFRVTDRRGILSAVNSSASQMIGEAAETTTGGGITLSQLLPDSHGSELWEEVRDNLDRKRITQVHIQYEGNPYTILAIPEATEAGNKNAGPTGTLLFYPQAHMSQAELDLYSYVRELEDAADTRDKGLQFLYRMSKKIGSAQNFDDLVDNIFADLHEIVTFDVGMLASFQAGVATVFIRSAYVPDDQAIRFLRNEVRDHYHESGFGGGEDPSLDVQIRDWNGEEFNQHGQVLPEKLGASITIPMKNPQEQILGVLHISSCNRANYTAEEIRLFATFSSRIALILHITNNLFLFNQMREMAIKDSLTGLYNRRYFEDQIEKEIERSRRYSSALSFLIMDIDHFKGINDSYGHLVGDKILKELARVIDDSIRHIDIPVRYGGEEFALILPETDLEGARTISERLRTAIEAHEFQFPGGSGMGKDSVYITVSAGVSHLSRPREMDAQSLLDQADQALYYAKEQGRNRTEVYAEIQMEPAAGDSPET